MLISHGQHATYFLPRMHFLCVPVEPEELVETDLRVLDTQGKVQHVSGNHGHKVQFELEAFLVALTQLPLVLHQKTLFQVPCTHTHIFMCVCNDQYVY